jgi:hypothetical protein
MATKDEWIGVAEVAAELKLSERAAWELVRRVKVPMLESGGAVMSRARFRRSDWEAARDASLKPAPARASKAAAQPPAPPTVKPTPAAAVAAKLARLRG